MRTLRNAVERDKVHHAYLFVGSRGTGKTSMAKILAACLNCERRAHDRALRAHASRAVSIARASSLDVIEMDAASNNSVEDIRELRESVAYAPVSGRRKIYILDEAHMLSTAAWNAFLKTLEEPPPNTVFVLATTEAGKVPPTVVDRCHRFDFQRPTVEQIGERPAPGRAEAESIEIPPEALAAIARSATGSFRDALGTLEQLVTYSGSEIALEDVLAVLGVADAGFLLADDRRRRPRRRAGAPCARSSSAPSRATTRPRWPATSRRAPASCCSCRLSEEVPPELSLTPEADRPRASRPARSATASVAAPARAARRGDGGRPRRRRRPHAARARAREGRTARARQLAEGAARPHRAPGGGGPSPSAAAHPRSAPSRA